MVSMGSVRRMVPVGNVCAGRRRDRCGVPNLQSDSEISVQKSFIPVKRLVLYDETKCFKRMRQKQNKISLEMHRQNRIPLTAILSGVGIYLLPQPPRSFPAQTLPAVRDVRPATCASVPCPRRPSGRSAGPVRRIHAVPPSRMPG